MKQKIVNAYNELIDFRPVDNTVVAAYDKVVKIINSCVSYIGNNIYSFKKIPIVFFFPILNSIINK